MEAQSERQRILSLLNDLRQQPSLADDEQLLTQQIAFVVEQLQSSPSQIICYSASRTLVMLCQKFPQLSMRYLPTLLQQSPRREDSFHSWYNIQVVRSILQTLGNNEWANPALHHALSTYCDTLLNEKTDDLTIVAFLELFTTDGETKSAVLHQLAVKELQRMTQHGLHSTSVVVAHSLLNVLLGIVSQLQSEQQVLLCLQAAVHTESLLITHSSPLPPPNVLKRLTVLLILKLLVLSLQNLQNYSQAFWSTIGQLLQSHWELLSDPNVINNLMSVFIDQDDMLVDMMSELLALFNRSLEVGKEIEAISQQVPTISVSFVRSLQLEFHPHQIFEAFLNSIHRDHLLLLDFLLSDDTQFLIYILQYVRFATNHISPVLDEIVPTLMILRLEIEKLDSKSLFSYNIQPLLNRIEQLEMSWEESLKRANQK